MAVRRGSYSRTRNASSLRRRTGWDFGPGGQTPLALSASTTAILGSGVAALIDGLTIARVRGYLDISVLTAGGASNGFHGAVGMCVVPANAFGIGITAINHPVTDAEWDGWMWHTYFRVLQGLAVGNASLSFRMAIDAKAKRKLTDGDLLVAVLETTEVGVSTAEVSTS